MVSLSLSLALASLLGPQFVAAAPARDALVLEAPATVELDGRSYAIAAGTISRGADGFTASQSVSMQNCVRPDGAYQVTTATAFRWSSGLRTIHLDPSHAQGGLALEWRNGRWVIALRSATGDLACDGELPPEAALLSNGFE